MFIKPEELQSILSQNGIVPNEIEKAEYLKQKYYEDKSRK